MRSEADGSQQLYLLHGATTVKKNVVAVNQLLVDSAAETVRRVILFSASALRQVTSLTRNFFATFA